MDQATVTSKGQITIPARVRRKLGLQAGDKVFFLDNGESVIMKKISPETAVDAIQEVLAPLATEHGFLTDDDVLALVDEYHKRENAKKPEERIRPAPRHARPQ